ncbi:aldehyde dehydrogenase family protein [Labrys wisconsinensis]|uniref:Aldehyde dehydrogenase (NAD+)/betaine-aldehyde dehydrogenase n=1 Tax=Labrys wisconsinensis TaxID=425677 RepID=A0ABU0JF08_9HYPH|nr:aldehyde dehydrogenase family protein [Labrys wisconsinensis]MDQ0472081.1 aldehyde dehydrogenase (NAD+)/betaine-aldehyde dehydrogenase [Labrys wisconsinensis]
MAYVTNSDRMLIGGELVHSSNGEFDPSINPANEAVIGRSPRGTTEDVARAVASAQAAWPAWAATTPGERGARMRAFGQALKARAEEILHVEVADTGNTITPMRGDVGMAVESLDYYAGLIHELKGETIPATPDNLHITLREPYGVVARIAPFNHPLMFAVARTAAALAAGNAVIVKPPETSPLSAMVLAEIAREALPQGVFNIVTGTGATVGDAIVRHPDIKRIAFIGSPGTGRAIQRAAADVAVKHVTLELGGKNPLIAFPDTDPDVIAAAAMRGMNFTWQGQSCGSTSRLLLHEDIHDAVLDRVVERVSKLRLGDPADPATDMGPVNSRVQLEKVLAFFEAAKVDGARLMTGGGRPDGAPFRRGFWVEPTVYADVRPGMRLWQEEVFGPILSVGRWKTVDEAVELANSTEYGLTGAVWTNDIRNALNVARRVRSGHIWINGCSSHFLGVPFGGMKNSGVGREEGIEEMVSYTEAKTINIMLN